MTGHNEYLTVMSIYILRVHCLKTNYRIRFIYSLIKIFCTFYLIDRNIQIQQKGPSYPETLFINYILYMIYPLITNSYLTPSYGLYVMLYIKNAYWRGFLILLQNAKPTES
jgi:hypothetical protein